MKKVLIIMFFVILLTGLSLTKDVMGVSRIDYNETNSTLTMEEAKEIAEQSECMDNGSLEDTYNYNNFTKTWWFDMDIEKEGCNPACVVDEESLTAEINWRCTGAIFPDDDDEDEDNETHDDNETDEDDDVGEGHEFRFKEQFKEKNRLKFENRTGVECPDTCNCQGRVITCPLENGGVNMTIYAGNSGNIIIHIKGVNVTTNVSIYNENGTLYGQFRNNQTKEIKILPDKIMDRIRERIRARLELHNITLDENATYQIQAQKRARLFLLFPVDEDMNIDMDSETGEIIDAHSPWWSFLSRDIKED